MPQPTIPSHPDIAANAAGASPPQVHQGAPTSIPMHPGVVAQQFQNVAPPVPRPNDFFANVALGTDEVDFEASLEAPPQSNSSLDPGVDLMRDDLLDGGQLPPEIQAQQFLQQQPTVPQQQPQVQQPDLAPTPQPQQQQNQAPSPESLRTAAIDFLRGNTYKFTDDEARRALTSPEEALPDLAARLHVNIVTEMAQQLPRLVETLVEKRVQQRTVEMEAKGEFFRRYPKLNRPEWQGTIAESIVLARQLKPNATRDQLMAEGAALAAYRIRSQAPRLPAQGRQAPFVPASPGTGGAFVSTNPQPGNVWADLAADPELFS